MKHEKSRKMLINDRRSKRSQEESLEKTLSDPNQKGIKANN